MASAAAKRSLGDRISEKAVGHGFKCACAKSSGNTLSAKKHH